METNITAVIKDIKGQVVGSLTLPKHFSQTIRSDIIKRSVLALQSHSRQPYGNYLQAGQASAKLSRRRRDYKTAYGYGISRVPRKILSRRGTQFYWVGAFAPGTVGGRRAHPPKTEKIFAKKINKKERLKAIRVALSASVQKDLVIARGHKPPEQYPVVVRDDFENITKTKDVLDVLNMLGFGRELKRAKERKIRAGRGKYRGRPYRVKKSLLVVVSQKCNVMKALKNILGVDVCVINKLNTELLAPGCHFGRLVLFTERAVRLLKEQNLFMPKPKKQSLSFQIKKLSNEKLSNEALKSMTMKTQ